MLRRGVEALHQLLARRHRQLRRRWSGKLRRDDEQKGEDTTDHESGHTYNVPHAGHLSCCDYTSQEVLRGGADVADGVLCNVEGYGDDWLSSSFSEKLIDGDRSD